MEVVPQTTQANWTYNITKHKQVIMSPVKDQHGNQVYKDGEPKINTFIMFRYRLVLHSEKYAAIIEYNINKPNRAKKVHFFSNRETKKQFLPMAMRRELVGRFNTVEAQQIVAECIDANS